MALAGRVCGSLRYRFAGFCGTCTSVRMARETYVRLSDNGALLLSSGQRPNDPQVILVPGTKDPGLGINSGDLNEADLDIEWAGAVARNAKIIYVNSGV